MKRFASALALAVMVTVPTTHLLSSSSSSSPSLTAQIGQTVTQTQTAIQAGKGQDVAAENIVRLQRTLAHDKANYGPYVYRDLSAVLAWLLQATQDGKLSDAQQAQVYFNRI